MCYSYGYNLAKESLIREKLGRFGSIESVLLRPAYSTSVRNFALVEFTNLDEAVACREFFLKEDENFVCRLALGDKRLEVNILVASKVMRPFEAVVVPSTTSSQQFPGLLSALSAGPTIPAVSMSQPAQSGGLAMIQTTLPLSNKAFLSDMDKTINDEIRMVFDQEHIKAAKEKDMPPVLKISITPLFMNSENRELTFEDEEPAVSDLQVVKIESGEPVELQIEKNQELLWSGFIIKGNDTKNTVGVDAYYISGEKSAFLEEMNALWPADHILNMSHKCDYAELQMPSPLTVMAFLPSNRTQMGKFLDFRNYFREKRIVTKVRHFRNKILYIFPYCKEFSSFVPLEDGQYMIGVFAEAKGNQNAGSVNPPSIQMVDGAQVASGTSQDGKENEASKSSRADDREEGNSVNRSQEQMQMEQVDSEANIVEALVPQRRESVDLEQDATEGFETPQQYSSSGALLGKRHPHQESAQPHRRQPNQGQDGSPRKRLKPATVDLEDDLIAPILPIDDAVADAVIDVSAADDYHGQVSHARSVDLVEAFPVDTSGDRATELAAIQIVQETAEIIGADDSERGTMDVEELIGDNRPVTGMDIDSEQVQEVAAVSQMQDPQLGVQIEHTFVEDEDDQNMTAQDPANQEVGVAEDSRADAVEPSAEELVADLQKGQEDQTSETTRLHCKVKNTKRK